MSWSALPDCQSRPSIEDLNSSRETSFLTRDRLSRLPPPWEQE